MVHAPETDRLRLRELALDDVSDLYRVFADPYAREFYPYMIDPERVRGWIEWNLRNYRAFGFGLWAVELKASGHLIGDCGLTYQDVEGTRQLEVGYHIVATERRKGHALEAARACLDVGFRQTESDAIYSIVKPSNVASCTVAARLHADCREGVIPTGPVRFYSTSRQDWERRRAVDGFADR